MCSHALEKVNLFRESAERILSLSFYEVCGHEFLYVMDTIFIHIMLKFHQYSSRLWASRRTPLPPPEGFLGTYFFENYRHLATRIWVLAKNPLVGVAVALL